MLRKCEAGRRGGKGYRFRQAVRLEKKGGISAQGFISLQVVVYKGPAARVCRWHASCGG